MWRYKNTIITGIIFSIVSCAYYLIVISSTLYRDLHGISHLFRDYPYMFVFTIIMIWQFQMMVADAYKFSRYPTVEKLLYYEVKEMAKRIAIFFILYIVIVSVIFIFTLAFSDIVILLYRCLILYIIFMVSFLFIVSSVHRNIRRNCFICFTCLAVLNLQVILYGLDNSIAMFNPFSILYYSINIYSLLRFVILIGFIIFWMNYRVDKKRVDILYDDEI